MSLRTAGAAAGAAGAAAGARVRAYTAPAPPRFPEKVLSAGCIGVPAKGHGGAGHSPQGAGFNG